MASNPAVRDELVANLRLSGGSVYGQSFGTAVRKVRPSGASMAEAKRAMNSLAYSTDRQPQVSIRKTGQQSGISTGHGGYHITLR